jgi:hypothetical protein
VPGSVVLVALAAGFRLPHMRWNPLDRAPDPPDPAVLAVPPSGVVDRRDDLSCHQTAADHLSAKLRLVRGFTAIYHLGKNGLSSLDLARRLGVSHYTAWKIQHKLMQVMLERDQDKPLTGERIEVDDAYIGGERSGGKRGRGSAGKTPFVAAVETTAEGRPVA